MPELSVLIKVETIDALSKVLTILIVLLLESVLLLMLLLRLVLDRETCSGRVTTLIVGGGIVLSVDVSVRVGRLRLIVVQPITARLSQFRTLALSLCRLTEKFGARFAQMSHFINCAFGSHSS